MRLLSGLVHCAAMLIILIAVPAAAGAAGLTLADPVSGYSVALPDGWEAIAPDAPEAGLMRKLVEGLPESQKEVSEKSLKGAALKSSNQSSEQFFAVVAYDYGLFEPDRLRMVTRLARGDASAFTDMRERLGHLPALKGVEQWTTLEDGFFAGHSEPLGEGRLHTAARVFFTKERVVLANWTVTGVGEGFPQAEAEAFFAAVSIAPGQGLHKAKAAPVPPAAMAGIGLVLVAGMLVVARKHIANVKKAQEQLKKKKQQQG